MYLGHEEYRERLRSIADQSPKAFPGLSKKKGGTFATLYSAPLIAFDDYMAESSEDIANKVAERLDLYMTQVLPAQTESILAYEALSGKPLWPNTDQDQPSAPVNS